MLQTEDGTRSILHHYVTVSGLVFDCQKGNAIKIYPPHQSTTMPDDEILLWNETRCGPFPPDVSRTQSVRIARARQGHNFIGGVGITQRTLADTYWECPQLKELLSEERGKVVMLGPGFGELLCELATLCEK